MFAEESIPLIVGGRVAIRLSLEKGVTRLRWNAGETFPE